MDYDAWAPTYEAILADFGWDPAKDHAAAQHLDALVPRGGWRHVGTELKNRRQATIVGCAAGLEDLTAGDFPAGVVIAADGATRRLRELDIVPRLVVTDLDGDMDAISWAAAQGSSIVVHAHGDNMDALDQVPELGPFVAGSCQGDPSGLQQVRNHGGFTDGDRAVLLCEAMGVRAVSLLAFDLDAEPSPYSGRFDPDVKRRKLQWAQRIIDAARARGLVIQG